MSKKVFSVLALSGFLFGLAAVAVTQEMPKPGPEHKALDFFAGKWEFNGEMKPGPMGAGGKIHTTDSCDWFEGGFALVCHGEGSNPSGEVKSVGILSYDMDKKAYTYYGLETGHPPAYALGEKTGDTWVYDGEGGGMKTRVTIKETSSNAYSFTFEISQDGSSWTTVMEGTGQKSST